MSINKKRYFVFYILNNFKFDNFKLIVQYTFFYIYITLLCTIVSHILVLCYINFDSSHLNTIMKDLLRLFYCSINSPKRSRVVFFYILGSSPVLTLLLVVRLWLVGHSVLKPMGWVDVAGY